MNPIEANANMYNNNQMGYTYTVPLSGTTTETMLPAAYNSLMNDSIPQKAAIKSESGLTYNIPIPISRKRSRDSMINPSLSFLSHHQNTPQPQKNCGSFSFLGEDISFQIQQHQFDIDRLISQHVRIHKHIHKHMFYSVSIQSLYLLIKGSLKVLVFGCVFFRWRR